MRKNGRNEDKDKADQVSYSWNKYTQKIPYSHHVREEVF